MTLSPIERLRRLNETMSQEKIARKLNVSSQTVYRWLAGKNSPSGLALEKILKLVSK